ncbi:MAG: flagellin [Acidimicrobiia bacterium]|nr:flagellin [Acidimicrobiia bacterium]MDH4309151.1 flagellin [Acidimicrobiia bacterium]MDH5293729.1 flagellin [Acidimicrobiia bacterium]
MRINNNVAALNSYRNLAFTSVQMGKSLEKLSSGFRINRAADDAAGLVKSESLRTEINGNKAAIKNAQDGISFVQTAEGALGEVHAILQRMRELAVDAANTATTDGVAQQAEVAELLEEVTAIGTRTTFAGNAVFADYTSTNLTFHIGAGSADQLSISGDYTLTASSLFGVNVASIDLTSSATSAIGLLDSAIAAVSSVRSEFGATQNRLEHTINNLSVAVENLTASESRIRDTDMAMEMANFTRHQILTQAGTSMLAQANQVPQNVLQLLGR